MAYTYGFIGTGNMGGAVAKAVCRTVGGNQVLLSNRTPEKAQALADMLGCAIGDNLQAVAQCRYLFLGVKPQNMTALMVARNDGEHYGEMVLYTVPKSKTVYGPMQIEAQINQNTEISADFIIWNTNYFQTVVFQKSASFTIFFNICVFKMLRTI